MSYPGSSNPGSSNHSSSGSDSEYQPRPDPTCGVCGGNGYHNVQGTRQVSEPCHCITGWVKYPRNDNDPRVQLVGCCQDPRCRLCSGRGSYYAMKHVTC